MCRVIAEHSTSAITYATKPTEVFLHLSTEKCNMPFVFVNTINLWEQKKLIKKNG